MAEKKLYVRSKKTPKRKRKIYLGITTVMILLLEGRMFTSIGLTYPQLVDYCAEIGMVNAGNMDGGASSVMYYQGEQNTIVSTLYGARNMPNCWLVAPES